MFDYLVILSGSPRGGTKTWETLFKFVINHLNADLALCTTDNFIDNNILFKNAKYNWILKNPNNFREYYTKKFSNNWENYLLKGKGLGLYESGMIHFALKDFILENHLDVVKKYKYIIFSRFDQLYIDFHPKFTHDSEVLFIPEGEDYYGVCDRHIMFESKYAEKFFSICDFIDSENTATYKDEFLNCEVTFRNHLMDVGIYDKVQRQKRFQFTTATKDDKTNWRVPKYKIYFKKDLLLKYPDEFMISIFNYVEKYGFFKTIIKIPIFAINYYYINFRIFIGKNILRKNSDD